MSVAMSACVRNAFLVVLSTVVGCSLIYDPERLPAITPAEDAGLETLAEDATAGDGIDGSQLPTDAAPGALDAAPGTPDAIGPDAAAPCGDTSQLCCANATCEPGHECSGGTCHACGGSLESCCDPGMTCAGALRCVSGVCVL